MTAPLLELKDVAVRFGAQAVLRGVSLAVDAGQTVAFIGESGCGKTCLLKLIVGLLKPSDGDVLFEGKSLGAMGEREMTAMRLRVGFLFQGAALFDSLTVFDNVAFGLKAKGGRTAAAIRDTVIERLREVGLPEGVETKMPGELSGGMKKRVGLARALALDPAVMLYDEPTTGLDPVMTDVINGLILQARAKRPVTSVIVTHEMRTVRDVADRVVMFHPLARLEANESQVVFDGAPAALAKSPDPRVRQFVEGRAASANAEFGTRIAES